MSLDTNDVPKLTVLEELKMLHAQYTQQKEQAHANYNQLIGAVFALEQTIKKHEDMEKSGDINNGEINNEAAQQTTEV